LTSKRYNSDDFGINGINKGICGEEGTTAVSLARIFSGKSSSTNLISREESSIVSGIATGKVDIRKINYQQRTG